MPLSELDRGFPSGGYQVNEAYAESADFVRFLMRDADRARFGSLLERVRAGVPFDRTLEDAYGADVRKLEYEWREELGRRFGVLPMLTGGGLLWVVVMALAGAAWPQAAPPSEDQARAMGTRRSRDGDATLAASRAAGETLANPRLPEDDVLPRVPSIPVVEHDGRWHTLH